MSDCLLTPNDVQRLLSISRRTFFRKKARLIAYGLREVRISDRLVRYQPSSVEKVMEKIINKGMLK